MLNVRERRAAQAKREATDLIGRYGEHRVAKDLDVHLTTVRRWYTGETVAPTPVLIALRALVDGQLPGMEHKDWVGWAFGRDGNLYSPAGEAFHRGDLEGQRYLRQRLKYLEHQVALLQQKIREMPTGAANDAVEGELQGMVHPLAAQAG